MKDRFRVLIISSCHWPLLARLPWVLRQAGCQVDLFAPANVLVGQSKYLSAHVHAPSAIAPFLQALEPFIEAHGSTYDWIICGDDPLLYALARRLEEPWVQRIFPARGEKESAAFLLSKSAFPMLGKDWGLPVPLTRVAPDIPAAVSIAGKMGYPLMVKNHLGFGGDAIREVHSEMDLYNALEKLQLSQNIILQQVIPGETCCGVALYNHGELRGWMAFRNDRSYPGPRGPATAITVLDLPQLEPLLETLGERTGFHGLGGVDFILNPETGEITLLEQHARPPQVFYLTPQEGSIDFARAIHRMLAEKPTDSPRCVKPKRSKSRPLFPKDLRQAIDEGDGLRLLTWLLCPLWWRDVPWHEPAVTRIYLKSLFNQIRSKFFPGASRKLVAIASQEVAKPVSAAQELRRP